MQKKIVREIAGNNQISEGPFNVLKGVYNGYYTIMNITPQQYIIMINATQGDLEPQYSISDYLGQMARGNDRIIQAFYANRSVTVLLKPVKLVKNIPGTITPVIQAITNFLRNNGYVTGCELCGNPINPDSYYAVNGHMHYYCDACCSQVGINLENRKDNISSGKNNVITGIIGAILGSLIAGVLWIIVAMLGYIIGWVGFITVILAIGGYKKFGGRVNLLGAVICSVISLAVIYFSLTIVYSIDIHDVVTDKPEYYEYYMDESKNGEEITYFDTYKMFFVVLDDDSDYKADFYKDLAVSYVFTIIAGASYIISAYKEGTGKYTIKKMKN